MIEIIPGILEKEWSEIEKKIVLVRPFAKTIHIDLLDGIFAPNTTFADPKPFATYTNPSAGSGLFFELHMMVDDPFQYLKPWADVGFRRFIGHVERMPDQAAFVARAEQLGEVGLAIDAKTPVEQVSIPLLDLDCLLVMTVKAGFSGQSFMQQNLEKVRAFRLQTTIPIAVDGGIIDETIRGACDAGANRFIATSFLFNASDPQEQYRLLKNACGH